MLCRHFHLSNTRVTLIAAGAEPLLFVSPVLSYYDKHVGREKVRGTVFCGLSSNLDIDSVKDMFLLNLQIHFFNALSFTNEIPLISIVFGWRHKTYT